VTRELPSRLALALPASLVASAVVLLLALLVLEGGADIFVASTEGLTVDSGRMRIAEGNGSIEPGGVRWDRLSEAGRARLDIDLSDLDASHFAFVRILLSQPPASRTRSFFLWGTAAGSENRQGTELARTGSGSELVAYFGRAGDSRGRFSAAQILFLGSEETRIGVRSVRLLPPSVAEYLKMLWRQWTERQGLEIHSSNFLYGGARQSLVPLIPFSAVWLGLACLLFLVWKPADNDRQLHQGVLLLLLAVWLVLDLRWQADLFSQLAQDRAAFAGLSDAEKQALVDDPGVTEMAEWIRATYQARPPRRVFVRVDDDRRDLGYRRLRLAYLLYPFNVDGVSNRLPHPSQTTAGDLIILADPGTDAVREMVRAWARADDGRILSPRYSVDGFALLEVRKSR
jgi:hypothetical protein